VFANFDGPYGFMKDFTTWISSFIGLSPLALIYLILKRDAVGKKAIPVYVMFILIISFGAYTLAYHFIGSFTYSGYLINFPMFFLASIFSAILSIFILPTAILHLGEVYLRYDYDFPLFVMELVILLFIILLSYTHYIRKLKKCKNRRGSELCGRSLRRSLALTSHITRAIGLHFVMAKSAIANFV